MRACGEELAPIGAQAPEPPGEIPRLHFTEAKEIARRRAGVDGRDEPDLSPAEERALGAWARDERGSELLFVEGHPLAKRPFARLRIRGGRAPELVRPALSAGWSWALAAALHHEAD